MKALPLFIILLFSVVAAAQDAAGSFLVDAWGSSSRLSCDDERGRLDSFFETIMRDPASTGRVVVYGQSSSPLLKIRYQDKSVGHAKLRNFPASRIHVLQGPDQAEGRIELWKDPPGADVRAKLPVADHKLSGPLLKSALFYSTLNEVYCPEDENREASFFQILVENPSVKGKVVLKTRSRNEFVDLRKKMLQRHRTSKGRVTFVYWKGLSDGIELWLEAGTN